MNILQLIRKRIVRNRIWSLLEADGNFSLSDVIRVRLMNTQDWLTDEQCAQLAQVINDAVLDRMAEILEDRTEEK